MTENCAVCGREKIDKGGFFLRGCFFCERCEAMLMALPVGSNPYCLIKEKIREALFDQAAGN